jgi:hypothetical protein
MRIEASVVNLTMAALELSFKGHVRRLSEVPSTFVQLSSLACSFFQVKTTSFKYVDEDQDGITVENQTEFEEVLRLLRAGPMTLTVLERSEAFCFQPSAVLGNFEHIANLPLTESQMSSDIEEDDSQTEPLEVRPPVGEAEEAVSQLYDLGDLKASVREIIQLELAQRGSTALKSRADTFRRSCSICMADTVEGVLYKCLTCIDYHLCSSCEEICQHPHPFFKLRKAAQLDSMPAVPQHDLNVAYDQRNLPVVKPEPPKPEPRKSEPRKPEPRKPVPRKSEPVRSNIDNVVRTMNELGFYDRDKILEAMRVTRYDIGAAVEYLLGKS